LRKPDAKPPFSVVTHPKNAMSEINTSSEIFQLGADLSGKRIVVAMSGGVDSSVVAALAARTGAETIGVTLQLYDHGSAVKRAGSCCAGQDIRDARAVADRLGIAHYVFDHESRFRDSVIEHFADEYMRGRTPIPCVRCNMGVKFTDLFRLARELGADCLATGHYVRRVEGAGGSELHRALDPARDQSYFLFATTNEQLDYLRFPLGGMPKPEVRAIAQEMGLIVANKPDSQDICFVPEGDYASVVRKIRPEAESDGAIVDMQGRELGRHRGLIHYTVGQRRGLELGGLVEPLYVIRLEPEAQRVVVGPKRALAVSAARLVEPNWLTHVEGRPVWAKVRSLAKPVPAKLEGGWLRFDSDEYGVAPGQAAVLYDGDRVLGGAWIEETQADITTLAA
jgi:tRNA-uridine 2-sulfurtransferase